MDLIEKLILPDFNYIRNDITELTSGMPLYHSILSGIALGDAKLHTAFKRANVSAEIGQKAIDELCDIGIISVSKSNAHFTSWKDRDIVENKLLFKSPFLRFWFAFVSPIFKGIRDGEYGEIRQRFENREREFLELPYTQLAQEFLKLEFKESDPLVQLNSAWNNEVEIDLYAKTKSGKIIAGVTKYTNSKLKKSTLTQLKESAKKLGIEADIYVIISKSGFSKELKSLKGENLKLYSLKSFKKLID
jgi:hypothetical protein